MKKLFLTKGYETLVDDEDYEYLSQWKWKFQKGTRNLGYATRTFKHTRTIYLHRFILEAKENVEVDHINGNTLDNRRSNLRLCSRMENCRNQKVRKDNFTGLKGVHFLRKDKFHKKDRYEASIWVNKKIIRLGYFDNPEKAKKAYDKAAVKYFGEFANI